MTIRYYILMTIVLFTACKEQEIQYPKEAQHQTSNPIVGTWQLTKPIDEGWTATATYCADGSFEALIYLSDSDSDSEPNKVSGSYVVKGDILERTIYDRMLEITYRIEGEKMYQKIGDKEYVYTKKITEQDATPNR